MFLSRIMKYECNSCACGSYCQAPGSSALSAASCLTWKEHRTAAPSATEGENPPKGKIYLFFVVVWMTHPSWMNSSKAAHSATNWGLRACRATKDRMGKRSSAPLWEESGEQSEKKEKASRHLWRKVTFTKFDGLFFPGDWKESKSNGALNGRHVWGDLSGGEKIPAWRWWQTDSIPLVCRQWPSVYQNSHAGLTACLLVRVRRQVAGFQLTQPYVTGYFSSAGSGRRRQTRVSAESWISLSHTHTHNCAPKL